MLLIDAEIERLFWDPKTYGSADIFPLLVYRSGRLTVPIVFQSDTDSNTAVRMASLTVVSHLETDSLQKRKTRTTDAPLAPGTADFQWQGVEHGVRGTPGLGGANSRRHRE